MPAKCIALFISMVLIALESALFAADPMGEKTKWDPIPPVDWDQVRLDQFSDQELDIPRLLFFFHRLANAVVEDGPNRGFIDLKVWRHPRDNEPYNARILENNASIAYFYTTDRPWNPYYASPAVRARLEAVLQFWCDAQNSEGVWSEYSADNWSLAPTGFGIAAMSTTLKMLARGPSIDPDLHSRVVATQKHGIMALLAGGKWVEIGSSWTNQYSAVYAAALGFMELFPDSREELMPLLLERMKDVKNTHQSPAGYLYEANGPDFAYTLSVHKANLALAWPDAQDSPIAQALISETEGVYEWASYNLVPQASGRPFLANHGIGARTPLNRFDRIENPLAEHVELARAFASTKKEHRAQIENARARLSEEWGTWTLDVPAFSSYSPAKILSLFSAHWFPSEEQRHAAFHKLPYNREKTFTHQLTDNRHSLTTTAIRRPSYYALFNSGQIITSRQRYGLGLLWTEAGTCMQTIASTDDLAWGTVPADHQQPIEAHSFKATFTINDEAVSPAPGRNVLPVGETIVTYPIGSEGIKKVTFGKDEIIVAIQTPGSFFEQLPMLVTDPASIKSEPGRLVIPYGEEKKLEIVFDKDVRAEIGSGNTNFSDPTFAVVKLHSQEALTYRFIFASSR